MVLAAQLGLHSDGLLTIVHDAKEADKHGEGAKERRADDAVKREEDRALEGKGPRKDPDGGVSELVDDASASIGAVSEGQSGDRRRGALKTLSLLT